jgi:RecA-family ATPase
MALWWQLHIPDESLPQRILVAEKLSDFLTKEIPIMPFVIGRGVLPVGGKMILAGSPKTGKSFLALNMVLDLVRGRRIFDASYNNGAPVLPVGKQWRVLYLEMELGEMGLLERLKGKDGKAGLMTGIDASGLELYLQPRDTAMRLDTREGRDYIRQLLDSIRPDVVVVDPLAKFNLSNENDAQEMGAIMRAIDHYVEDFRCAWIIVHHIGKQDPDPAKQKRGGDRLRGSSAIFADVDTLLEVTSLSSPHTLEPVLKLQFELRRGEPIEDLFIKRHRDGVISWLGDGYSWGQEANGKTESYPKNKYKDL